MKGGAAGNSPTYFSGSIGEKNARIIASIIQKQKLRLIGKYAPKKGETGFLVGRGTCWHHLGRQGGERNERIALNRTVQDAQGKIEDHSISYPVDP